MGKRTTKTAETRPKRRCSQKTRKGKPCRAWALHGTDRCMAHTDKVKQAEVGFGGALNGAKGGAAGRVPKLTELLRAEVEARAEEIIAKLFMGLAAQRAVVVGTGPKARLEFAPDPDIALKTIREIFDRAEGRPMQRTESKSEVTHIEQSEFDRRVAALVEQMKGNRNGNARSRSAA